MSPRRAFYQIFIAIAAVVFCASLSGCPSGAEGDVLTALQGALTSLNANRGLSEQLVRDIKANVSPSDPQFPVLMEGYADAREAYNRFLDAAETDTHVPVSRSLRNMEPADVQRVATDFVMDAERALDPAAGTRRARVQRAVLIPEELHADLERLPRKTREKFIDTLDKQVRWRSWSELCSSKAANCRE